MPYIGQLRRNCGAGNPIAICARFSRGRISLQACRNNPNPWRSMPKSCPQRLIGAEKFMGDSGQLSGKLRPSANRPVGPVIISCGLSRRRSASLHSHIQDSIGFHSYCSEKTCREGWRPACGGIGPMPSRTFMLLNGRHRRPLVFMRAYSWPNFSACPRHSAPPRHG
jgi:hypothetical protein